MAPTSKSSRPWQFVIVEDAARLEALSKCKETGAMPIAKAPLAIVVAVDVEASDPWIEDAAIAATFIQLQAQDLGLGSVWIQVRDRFDAEGVPADEFEDAAKDYVKRTLRDHQRIIFNGDGYSAGYYSYIWAEVLDTDGFELFKERGIFDPATAKAFRENVLEMGGSEDPMQLYINFRGRKPDANALLRNRGLIPEDNKNIPVKSTEGK